MERRTRSSRRRETTTILRSIGDMKTRAKQTCGVFPARDGWPLAVSDGVVPLSFL